MKKTKRIYDIRSLKRCEDCGKKTRRIRQHKGQLLCFNCYRKKIKIMPIAVNPFGEPLSEQVQINFMLTAKQKEKLVKRLAYVFPNIKSRKGGLRKTSEYIRELILVDLENFKEDENVA